MTSRTPLAIAAILFTAPHAMADAASPLAMTDRALKSAYLACEENALNGPMDRGDAIHCSHVYEVLKSRVFGGDWSELKAWSDIALNPASAT